MMKWEPHRIIVLILGLWFAIAPAMIAVSTESMAAQISMANSAGSGDCNDCPDAGMDRDICALMCANALTFAIVSENANAGPVVFQINDWPVHHLSLTGRNLVPDPGPPRSVQLS